MNYRTDMNNLLVVFDLIKWTQMEAVFLPDVQPMSSRRCRLIEHACACRRSVRMMNESVCVSVFLQNQSPKDSKVFLCTLSLITFASPTANQECLWP